MKVLSAFISLVAFAWSSHAAAQNYDQMIQNELQKGQQMAQQMQQMQNGIVQQNMQNPQVQQMYQNYLAQGGTMSFPDFAYQYAAQGGFTPEGKQRAFQTQQDINRQNQIANEGYRNNQLQNQQTYYEMQRRQDEIARARGNLLNGTTDYVDPRNGNRYNLPHTVQPGTTVYDPGAGTNYYNDPQGNYYRGDDDGYFYGLDEAE